MQFISTPIPDLFVLEPKLWSDNRGYFYESYQARQFEAMGIEVNFVQDNQSYSQIGTLRGLHAQKAPSAQAKLVRVVQGKVLDIAIDIRKNSATYGQHFAIELSGENHLQLYIPTGFLHGFLTLAEHTIFQYKVSSYYDKEAEVGVIWNDPSLALPWADYLDPKSFLISEKDLKLPLFEEFQSPF
ncbi:MAG: dTDP-4-dehydrorhamnose 3,5-epimerase [Pedobacter sp.]|nr:MAG: dTDP-4-dehydrorhamnose 3,5-epimerase [Pedobacter sp.]